MPKLLIKAQKTFNTFIRNRDKDKGCISCGGPVEDAGHYYSQGHHSMLRFNEVNVQGQCRKCNYFLHGNLLNFQIGLNKRYDRMTLMRLSLASHEVKKWTRFELEEIIKIYGRLQD